MKTKFFIILTLLFSFTVNAKELELCKVTRIIDGDTIEVIYRDEKEKVRLWGIDTPERGEPDFERSTAATRILLENKYIAVSFPDINKRDHFGRLLANVYLAGGYIYINKYLFDQGYAKLYKNTKPEELEYYATSHKLDPLTINKSLVLNNDISTLKHLFSPENNTSNESGRIFNLEIALFFASRYAQSPEMLRTIVELGANINTIFPHDLTTLHLAAIFMDNIKILNTIIDLGADINAKDDEGKTPLDYARNTQNTNAITALIKAGADTSIR